LDSSEFIHAVFMTQSLSLKTLPAPLRLMVRPMLLMALGIHALLLFTPLPSEQKPKEPDDKKNPIKITQLPTAKPPEAKPVAVKAKVAVRAANPAPASSPTSAPLAAIANPLPAQAPPPALAPLQTTPTASPSSSTPVPTTPTVATSGATFKGDAAKALQELLVNLPGTKKEQVGAETLPAEVPLTELNQPELLFNVGQESASKPMEKRIGLDRAPLLVLFPLEANLNLDSFYRRILEPKLKGIFESITPIGEYGEGPLYKLSHGSYTTYLSLMSPKQAVGAIVSVWSKDPRPNSSTPGQ
jgi:hypothetical protein